MATFDLSPKITFRKSRNRVTLGFRPVRGRSDRVDSRLYMQYLLHTTTDSNRTARSPDTGHRVTATGTAHRHGAKRGEGDRTALGSRQSREGGRASSCQLLNFELRKLKYRTKSAKSSQVNCQVNCQVNGQPGRFATSSTTSHGPPNRCELRTRSTKRSTVNVYLHVK